MLAKCVKIGSWFDADDGGSDGEGMGDSKQPFVDDDKDNVQKENQDSHVKHHKK